jgi:hypothetical protein
MVEERSAEELERRGERRMKTAIVSVAVIYALVAVAAIAGTVILAVYLVTAIFF